jgi:hypothetical protein
LHIRSTFAVEVMRVFAEEVAGQVIVDAARAVFKCIDSEAYWGTEKISEVSAHGLTQLSCDCLFLCKATAQVAKTAEDKTEETEDASQEFLWSLCVSSVALLRWCGVTVSIGTGGTSTGKKSAMAVNGEEARDVLETRVGYDSLRLVDSLAASVSVEAEALVAKIRAVEGPSSPRRASIAGGEVASPNRG